MLDWYVYKDGIGELDEFERYLQPADLKQVYLLDISKLPKKLREKVIKGRDIAEDEVILLIDQ